MSDLYGLYHRLDSGHPYRRAVSIDALRRYVLQGATSEQFTLHVVLFENILFLDENSPKWDVLHIVDEQQGTGQSLQMYFNTLWLLIDPNPSQIKRILSDSLDDVKRRNRDTELQDVANRVNAMTDSKLNTLWYTIGAAMIAGLVSFGLWCLKMFVSGAWRLASTGIEIAARNGLVGEIGAAALLNQAIESLIVPVVRDVLAEIAYQSGLTDEEWIVYNTQNEGDMTYDELFRMYRLRRIPSHNELLEDPGVLEAVQEDFRVLYMSKPNADLPGQGLTQEAFTDESIEMTISSIEGRVVAGGQLSASQARTLAELKWTRLYRTLDDLDAELPEPLPPYQTVVADTEDVVVNGRLALSAVEEDVAVSAVSSEVVASAMGGVVGVVLGVGLVVYQKILLANARNRVIGLIDDANQSFKWRLEDLETKLGAKIDVPVMTTVLGTVWNRKTFRWSAKDVLSESVLSYMRWRLDNPGIVEPSVQAGASVVSQLYLEHLSIGALIVYDWWPQEYTPEQYGLCSKLGLNTINGDEKLYLQNYATMRTAKVQEHGAAFEAGIRDFLKTHRLRPTETASASDILAATLVANHVQSVPTWSLLPGRSVKAGASFQAFASEKEAMDHVASMSVPVWDIQAHIECMRRFSTRVIDTMELP
jgi:hypothetical protein